MSRTMSRWVFVGAAALAVFGAAGALAPGAATAEAAPSTSPFVGTYFANVDGQGYSGVVKISTRGAVSGSSTEKWSIFQWSGTSTTKLAGTVTDSGALSVDIDTQTTTRDGVTKQVTKSSYHSHLDATVTLDSAGDLVGADSYGNTFTWLRQ